MFIRLRRVPERTRTRSGACMSDTYMRIAPTRILLDVNPSPEAQTALWFEAWPANLQHGTLRPGIFVGRRRFSSRMLHGPLTSAACASPDPIGTTALATAVFS
jgi:hypothetical protein